MEFSRGALVQVREVTEELVQHINRTSATSLQPGDQVVVVCRRSLELGNALDDQRLAVRAHIVGNGPAVEQPFRVRPPPPP